MPIETRKKSFSLTALGINIPGQRMQQSASTASAAEQQPPSKKIKRSHSPTSPSPMSPPSKPTSKPVAMKYEENTPPPSPENGSPECEVRRTVDRSDINDDIVEAVVIQIEKTGNRPHLVKELATILSTQVKIVETSANQSAIVSSRLSTYLKRPCWSASNPCPIAKELETVHPRRTYFYLTTYPHQPIPDPAQAAAAAEVLRISQRTIISPSLSSAASQLDDAENERRRELSPSPEVDLSTPELDEMEPETSELPPTPSGSFSGRLSHQQRMSPSSLARSHRAASPPLEKDEKEFTQTAWGMQKRQMSQDQTSQTALPEATVPSGLPEVELNGVKAVVLPELLFMESKQGPPHSSTVFVSSPAMRPVVLGSLNLGQKRGPEEISGWQGVEWDVRRPENIELDELEGLLEDF